MEPDSYPPQFRTRGQHVAQLPALDSDYCNRERDQLVPRLDYKRLESDEDSLVEACKDWGLFYLLNHDVPMDLVSRLQDRARSLFSLPFETKQSLLTEPLSYFWGTPALTPSGTALSCGPKNINWLEGINAPCAQLPHFQPSDPLLNEFRLLLQEYGKHMARVADHVFDVMANSLKLKRENKSNYYLSEETGFVRFYRYPKCDIPEDGLGMSRHTDSSVLSILCQDHVAGLEVFRDEKWHLVHPLPNSLVVNIGDIAQAISDDKYNSAVHRVRASRFAERLSIGYFTFPPHHRVIQSQTYCPFTYSDFQQQVQQDIKTLGTKIGLSRFKIPKNA